MSLPPAGTGLTDFGVPPLQCCGRPVAGATTTDWPWMTEEASAELIQTEPREADDAIDDTAAAEANRYAEHRPDRSPRHSLGALGETSSTAQNRHRGFRKDRAIRPRSRQVPWLHSLWGLGQRTALRQRPPQHLLAGADTLLLREAAGRDVQELRRACESLPDS